MDCNIDITQLAYDVMSDIEKHKNGHCDQCSMKKTGWDCESNLLDLALVVIRGLLAENKKERIKQDGTNAI